ncbi:MAG TPA: hypothetical protein VF845_01050 [Terriglobales bacterium]
MRRVHLRGRDNILKRVLIHVGGFNLSLVRRQLLGKGTPRGLQGFSADSLLILLRFWNAILVRTRTGMRIGPDASALTRRAHRNSYPACGGVNKPPLPRAARDRISPDLILEGRPVRAAASLRIQHMSGAQLSLDAPKKP